MNLTKKRVIIGATVAAVVLSGTGVAYAYWTTSGTGSGTAATSAGAANLTITQDTTLAAMFPGDSPQTFSATVLNNAANSATVASLGAYITTNKVGCDGTDFLINGSSTGSIGSPTSLGWTSTEIAAAGQASTNGTDTVQFNDKVSTNQDICKAAVVTIHYVAS
jgi:hypothetical protein